MKFFWDTNLFIYLIEKHPVFYPKVLALYERQRKQGDTLITSTLTLGELIAQPLRLGRSDLVDRYTALLVGSPQITLVGFDSGAARHYATIRAGTNLKQPDAIQLACAITAGADVFITNDKALWGMEVPGITEILGL